MPVDLATWHMFWKRQGSRELRDILMLWWDPVGVHGVPEALDEYDGYVGKVSSRLQDGASVDQIAEYLGSIDFGLDPEPERDHRAATKAVEWYEQSVKRLAEWSDGLP